MKVNTLLKCLSVLFLVMIYSCDNDDPCDGIICENGGVCVNGACDCPEGYTGPDCSNQQTPSTIRVTNIKVTRFPATDSNGGGWDLLSGADIFVTIHYNNNEVYEHPTFIQNADPGVDHNFSPSINLNLTNPTSAYVISLYDFDDFDPDDFIGGIEFTPYSNNNGFPTILTLDANGTVAFELTMTYSF